MLLALAYYHGVDILQKEWLKTPIPYGNRSTNFLDRPREGCHCLLSWQIQRSKKQNNSKIWAKIHRSGPSKLSNKTPVSAPQEPLLSLEKWTSAILVLSHALFLAFKKDLLFKNQSKRSIPETWTKQTNQFWVLPGHCNHNSWLHLKNSNVLDFGPP